MIKFKTERYNIAKLSILILSCILLSACVYTPDRKVLSIKEVEPHNVRRCTLLGQVSGRSQYSYLALGTEMAKDAAKCSAYDIGATHIVWQDLDSGLNPLAVARAYRCR